MKEAKTIPLDALRSALKHQYHAALAMLKQAIERCPEEVWVSRAYVNPTWRIAYHVLYFTHLYLQRRLEDFAPWEHHQTGIHDLDDDPTPPSIAQYCELPHRPPRTGRPLTKAEILEYWSLCDRLVDGVVDDMDLLAPESGFWYRMPKLEHQLVNLRHIQHHTAQIGLRLREATKGELSIDWVGRRKA